MTHKSLALILATGGAGLVKSAYSSGTPTIGVGAGNVPVYIERSADIPFAVEQIMISKLFDYGTIFASEQAMVVERGDCRERGGGVPQAEGPFPLRGGSRPIGAGGLRPQPGRHEPGGRGPAGRQDCADWPASTCRPTANSSSRRWRESETSGHCPSEILAPILAWYVAEDFHGAVNLCIDLNFYGGIGHTVSIFSNDDARITEFAMLMNAGRIVVNTPSSQGAVGGIYNMLHPSLTLGCGTGGKNITTDNVTASHLLNIQRIARRRENQRLHAIRSQPLLRRILDPAAVALAYNKNF